MLHNVKRSPLKISTIPWIALCCISLSVHSVANSAKMALRNWVALSLHSVSGVLSSVNNSFSDDIIMEQCIVSVSSVIGIFEEKSLTMK